MSDLDHLLSDLERTIETRGSDNAAATSTPVQRVGNLDTITTIESSTTTQKMATTAVSNPVSHNINELDVLLQDLSNARYSNSMQRMEQSVTTTTKSYSTMVGAPAKPLDRRGPLEEAVIREMESSAKLQEHRRSAERGVPVNGDLNQSKWEYMGYGIWENSEDEGGAPRPTPPPPQVQQQRIETTSFSSRMVEKSASSATQELDDLMTSLNTFKLREGKVEEPVNTSLDLMLGNLQEDMDKQGIRTTQKGVCFACQKPIVGQVITALGRTWHPEHFVCAHCNQELGTQNFFERDGKPYCEQDYHTLFSPRCAYCNHAILDKCISALDKTWHPEHFFCADCGRNFGEDGFHEKDDKAFCQDCFFSMFAPKCGGCSQSITENYISSLNSQWHPNCFVCRECKQPFVDGNFFEHDGFPYCETHYHALRGSLCAGCHKPISGRCITAMFRKFHPEHFVCSFCLKQLNKGTFKEQGEKPYCHECFDRLFG